MYIILTGKTILFGLLRKNIHVHKNMMNNYDKLSGDYLKDGLRLYR